MLFIKQQHPEVAWLFHLGIVFLLGFFSITIFYWVATKRFYLKSPRKTFFSLYPRFLIVSMGLSLHNGLAVLEGLIGRKTAFVRTPKFNVTNKKESLLGNSYIRLRITGGSLIEGLLSLYFMFGIVAGVWLRDGGLIFFHFMLVLGFGSVFYFSMKTSLHD
jgi:hypothetical protein